MENKYKLVLFVIILIFVFVVITYLKNLNVKEQTKVTQQNIVSRPLSCEESCNNNEECLKSCYIITSNKAVASKNINLCSEIPDKEIKQTCKDNVNFNLAQLNNDISRCELISKEGVKETCKNSLR